MQILVLPPPPKAARSSAGGAQESVRRSPSGEPDLAAVWVQNCWDSERKAGGLFVGSGPVYTAAFPLSPLCGCVRFLELPQ